MNKIEEHNKTHTYVNQYTKYQQSLKIQEIFFIILNIKSKDKY